MKDFYTVAEFSEKKHVSRETVRRWLRNGKYPEAYRKSKKIGWVIPIHEVHKEKKENDIFPIFDDLIFHIEALAELRKKEIEHLEKIHEYCLDLKFYEKQRK